MTWGSHFDLPPPVRPKYVGGPRVYHACFDQALTPAATRALKLLFVIRRHFFADQRAAIVPAHAAIYNNNLPGGHPDELPWEPSDLLTRLPNWIGPVVYPILATRSAPSP